MLYNTLKKFNKWEMGDDMDEKNGWLFDWWKRFKCGAVYGHVWKKLAEDFSSNLVCECVRCHKARGFNPKERIKYCMF